MEKFYKVSAGELTELIHDSMKFFALVNAGVEDWEGYNSVIHDFIIANGVEGDSVYKIAQREVVDSYEEVE